MKEFFVIRSVIDGKFYAQCNVHTHWTDVLDSTCLWDEVPNFIKRSQNDYVIFTYAMKETHK